MEENKPVVPDSAGFDALMTKVTGNRSEPTVPTPPAAVVPDVVAPTIAPTEAPTTEPVANLSQQNLLAKAAAEASGKVIETTEPVPEYWKTYGEFDTEDAFKEKYSNLNKQAEEYSNKELLWNNTERELKESLTKAQDFSKLTEMDDGLLRLNILKKNGSENYKEIAKLVMNGKESFNPLTVLKDDMINSHPELKEIESDVIDMIKEKYSLNGATAEELEDMSEADVKRNNLNIKMSEIKLRDDANAILGKYETELNAIDIPRSEPPTKEQMVVKQENAKQAWSPYLQKFTESIGKMSVPVKTENGDVPFESELTSTQIEKYSNELGKLVYDNAIELNEGNIEEAASVMRQIIWQDQISNLAQSIHDKVVADQSKFWETKLNNPSGVAYKTNTNTTEASNIYDAGVTKLLGLNS